MAAAAGAEVTGVDIAPGLLDQARAAATDAGLDVTFDLAPDSRRSFPEAWGQEDGAEELLGGAFELTIEEHAWELHAASADDACALLTTSAPPMKALHDMLSDADRARLKERLVEYWRGFETGDGFTEPRRYLLILGRRR